MNKKNIGYKILHFPFAKIIIGLIVCGVIVGVGQILFEKALELTSIDKDLKNLIGVIFATLLVVITY